MVSCSQTSCGKLALRDLLHLCLELVHHALQVLGGQVDVEVHFLLFLDLVDDVLELVLLDAHDHVAEHLDEPAVGVPGEALVAGPADQALDGLVVQAQVQDRVHHARHGELGAGADRNQERPFGIAELEAPAQGGLHLAHVLAHLAVEALGHPLAELIEQVADLGRDRESRRHRHAGVGHFRQAGALAAEQVLHGACPVSLSAAEKINVFLPRSHVTILPGIFEYS